MRAIETKIDNTSPSSTGRLKAEEFNALMTENEEAVRTAGIDLDASIDTDTQMLAQAQSRYSSGGTYGRDIGAANAYVVVSPLSFIMPKALFEGMRVRFFPKNNNSGASTLNAWALGAKKILDQDGNAVASGAIKAGRMTEVDYDPSLDSGAGGWKLTPGYKNNIVSGGGTSTITSPGTGTSVLRPCLTGITGDLTNLSNCGAPIASSYRNNSSTYAPINAFDGTGTGTPGASADSAIHPQWMPTPSTVPTNEWIGWDYDNTVVGYYATVNQAKFQQGYNSTNGTDVWLTVQVEFSQDLLTWVPCAIINATEPGADSLGPIESVSFTAVNARAFRLRPTLVHRRTSAALLIQTVKMVDVQFIKV